MVLKIFIRFNSFGFFRLKKKDKLKLNTLSIKII